MAFEASSTYCSYCKPVSTRAEMYCIAHMNDELDAVLMGWELVVAGAGGWMEPRLFVESCNGLSSNQ
jgi:hypothetical protein